MKIKVIIKSKRKEIQIQNTRLVGQEIQKGATQNQTGINETVEDRGDLTESR